MGQPGQPGQEQGRGAQGRGGRGGQGGPGATDAANAEADFTKQPPVLPLPAAEQQKQFVLQPGYRIAPVLTDPDIKEPGAIAFDGNGRMFVARVARLHAGRRRHRRARPGRPHLAPRRRGQRRRLRAATPSSSTSLSSLASSCPFGANSVLTMESNADEVWQFTDTNNDGVADKKELFTTNFGRAGNVEHQQAFLYWGMDNWLYSTVNAFRVRWTPNGVIREPTGTERRAVGRHAGQRRQDVVSGRRERPPVVFPVSDSLRQLHGCRSVRDRTSRFPGARRCASPTCSPGCAPCGCPMARSIE